MTPTNGQSPGRTRESGAHRWGARAARAVALGILGVLSLLVALAVTHPVDVDVLGQDVQVGAVAPSTTLGWSGPGQADLFGEGPVPTVQQFDGPIRPHIQWRQFNRDAAASAFIQTSTEDGRRAITDATSAVGDALARGWIAYFGRLVIVAGLVGALGYLVVVALGTITRGPRAPVRTAPRRVLTIDRVQVKFCNFQSPTTTRLPLVVTHSISPTGLTGDDNDGYFWPYWHPA